MRHLLFLFLFYFPLSISAQGLKGDWLFNGDFRASHYDLYLQKSDNSVEYDVQIGRFIKNGLCMGAIFRNNYGLNAYSEKSYGALPFVRASLNSSTVRPFIQVEGGRIWHKYKFQSFIPGDKYQETILNVRLGLAAFLNKNVVFEFQLKDNLAHINKFGSYKFSERNGVSLEFKMNFLLAKNNQNNGQKVNFFLSETVLKKGNKSFTTSTEIQLKKEKRLAILNLGWSKMLNDKFRFSLSYRSQQFKDPLGYISYNIVTPSIQHYYGIRKSTFFSPTTGVRLHGAVHYSTSTFQKAYSIFYRPSITQFLKKASLELGFEGFCHSKMLLKSSFFDSQDWGIISIAAGEYYLTPQLAIRGELWGNLLGASPGFESLYIFAPEVGNGHFRLGIRYFYQKKQKN